MLNQISLLAVFFLSSGTSQNLVGLPMASVGKGPISMCADLSPRCYTPDVTKLNVSCWNLGTTPISPTNDSLPMCRLMGVCEDEWGNTSALSIIYPANLAMQLSQKEAGDLIIHTGDTPPLSYKKCIPPTLLSQFCNVRTHVLSALECRFEGTCRGALGAKYPLFPTHLPDAAEFGDYPVIVHNGKVSIPFPLIKIRGAKTPKA